MYEDFFEEYLTEATEDMKKFLLENADTGMMIAQYEFFRENGFIFEEGEEPEGRAGVYKINYYFRDHIQTPLVTPKLSKRKIQDAIIEFTGKFMDEHNKELSASGPVHFFAFGDNESSFFFDLFGITGDVIVNMFYEMVKETYYGKISKFFTGWVENAPHKVLLTAILIDAIQHDYEDIITCCEYLWAFSEYPLIYRYYWKIGVKEDVMNYTIEHLGSKYKVKKVNNLQGLLKYDAHSSVSAMTERLRTGADHTYMDLMQRMRNQINNTFKNISKAYYDNDEANATQHSKSAQFDDGTLADQEGHSTNIAQVVDKTINKFSSSELNMPIVRIAADGAKVDKDILAGFINQIFGTKNNRLYKLVENVITAYFNKYPNATSVGSNEFVNYGIALYRSIGTSKDPLYHEIREILDYWMFTIINIRQYYQRDGTIINYTRGIFNYIIFMINYYN